MNRKIEIALAAIVATGMPLAAGAGGFYVGAGVGSASYESTDFVDCAGEFCESWGFDDNDIAYNIFAGFAPTDAVAVELGYFDLGELKDEVFGDTVRLDADAITVMAVGTAPLSDNFALFGKAGVAFLSIDASVDGLGGSVSADSQDLALGGGLQWNIGNFGIRGEALWIDAEDANSAVFYGVSGLWGLDW